MEKNKYFHITPEKELADIKKLCTIIADSGWVDNGLIIINCSPDYSSALVMTINHRLSHLNSNELFEIIPLEIPYPTHNQVWNPITKQYENFDSYLKKWVEDNSQDSKFLFVNSGTLNGRNFNKVHLSIRSRMADFRFASVYLQDDSTFTPDFYVQKFNKPSQGGLLFHWENANNPNWDY